MHELNRHQANEIARWFLLQDAIQKEAEYDKLFPGAGFRFPTPSFFLDTIEACVRLIYRTTRQSLSLAENYTEEQWYEELLEARAFAVRHGMKDEWAREYLIPQNGTRYVVASANKYGDLITAVGARHGSPAMNLQLNAIREEKLIDLDNKGKAIQGFIDQWDVFMTREEAWEVAIRSGQLNLRRLQGTPNRKELFSEDVW